MQLGKSYKRLNDHHSLAPHDGIFRRRITLAEAVALIMSGAIGAGVLGIPYAIAQVGVPAGIIAILVVGALTLAHNLTIGDIAIRAKVPLQLPGLAERFAGPIGKWLMVINMYTLLIGSLMVYIIGEGQTLSTLFGGTPFAWSVIFFVVATLFVFVGLRTVKIVELIFTLAILGVVILITFFSLPHITLPNLGYSDLAELFFPYGVLLFAFHSARSIPEAHSTLISSESSLKPAIWWAGIFVTFIYLIFAIVVVGVTGAETTEIATIGLGKVLGDGVFMLGNIFAALAMGTSFLMSGVSLRDSLAWDFKIHSALAAVLVCGIPFVLFLLGLRGFIEAIDLLGGIFITTEIVLMAAIGLRAKRELRFR
jgi:amino acid permease